MLEGRHFQNAYVTRDIDKAVEKFRTRVGVEDAQVLDATFDVDMGGETASLSIRYAFIWRDGLQYELIEPVAGKVDLYRELLPPAGDDLRFHHICMRIDDWDAFRAKVARGRYPIIMEGDRGAWKFLYLDARDFLGHYLEYCWVTPEYWALLGGS